MEPLKQTRRPPGGGLRARAEARLRRAGGERRQLSTTELKRVVHELEVHQVELKMQNEELRQAQVELAQARDRFSDLYDFAPVGYLTLDARKSVREVNLTAARMLGVSRGDLLGRSFTSYVARGSQDDLYLLCQAVVMEHRSHACDLVLRRADGSTLLAHLEGSPFVDGSQAPLCHAAFLDVTDRLRAEAALQQSERRLRRTQEIVHLGTWELDLTTRRVNCSDEVYRIFGLKSGQTSATYAAFLERVHPEDRAGVEAAFWDSVRAGEAACRFDHRIVRKSTGEIRWVQERCEHLCDASGKGIRSLGTVLDITDLKRAEARLQQLNETLERRVAERTQDLTWVNTKLRASEQALDDFFGEAPLGLLWVAPDGRILRANQAQAAMLGYDAEELPGWRLADFCADPDVVPAMVSRLAKRESVHDNLARFRRKGGSILHVLVDANGAWQDGKLSHSRWFVRDVTRRIELQKEILDTGERVRQQIGHDLHDDLCQQLAGIEFLSRALERELAGRSRPEAARAGEIARLTRQANSYSRELSHVMSPMELAAEGLPAALRNLEAQARRLFQVDCRFQGDTRFPVKDRTVQTHLYRIAQEAINNAIRHGKARHIQIRLRAKGGRIVLELEDDGVGLPRKLERKGGFGLRIMDYRASALGGTLAIQNRKGGGTILICSIPKPVAKPERQESV